MTQAGHTKETNHHQKVLVTVPILKLLALVKQEMMEIHGLLKQHTKEQNAG